MAHGHSHPLFVWFWDDDGGFVEIEFMGSGPHVRRYRRDYVVTASQWGSDEVERLTWRDGRAVRSDGARRANGTTAHAREADYSPDGELQRIRDAHERGGAGDLRAGLERAATLVPERAIWDARVDAPEPWPDDGDALVEPLAAALDRAVRGAIADAPVPAPFVAEVIVGERAFVPRARVVGTAWRDQMRGRSKHDGAAISDLRQAVAAGHGVEVDLLDRLDEAALRACRAFTTAFHGTAIWTRDPRSDAVADAVGDRLAALLNATPVAGAAEPFLALVGIGGRSSDAGHERARRTAPRFEHFMASVTSTRGKGGKRTSVKRALADRDALEAYLREGGLPGHAARLAHEVAQLGFRLDRGRGRSRLGGRALLPPGEPWPVSDAGRPHTFLAGIDLSELPASALPEHGWLLFFADLGDDDVGFCEDDDNRPGSMARGFFAEAPVEAEPSGGDLAERRVVPKPFLTLPNGDGARQTVGLDVFEGRTYEELADALAEPTWNDRPHWVGGWTTGPQGVVADDDTVLLLQIADDEELGFSYLDAGVIQFRIPPGALAERDWSRIVALADSS